MNRIYLFAFILCLTSAARAQNEDRMIVAGAVFDASTNEPLPYANISFDQRRYGVVCNGSGQFKVLIPRRFENELLTVSFLGYESQQLIIKDDQKPLSISLKPSSIQLKEATVTSYTGKYLYQKAIDAIPRNYLGKRHVSKGFYRVTTQSGTQYIHLSEAVFDIYKDGTDSNKKPFLLRKMRAIKDEAAAHGITIGHSPRSIITNDIATASGAILTSKSLLKTHDFELLGQREYDNQTVYEVSFRQKPGLKKEGFIGTVLIDQETFAFIRFEYEANPETVQHIKIGSVAMRALMAIAGIKASYLGGKFLVNYKRIGDHYFLSDVKDNVQLFFKNERENYQFETDLRSDYVVTAVQLEDFDLPSKEDLLKNSKMIENQRVSYDQEFWDNFNIILPDSDFGEIARSIEMRNKQHDYKSELESVIFKYPKEKSIRIDSILSFYNRKGLFNGNALVTYEDEVIFKRSYNNAETKNDEHSLFRIGSTSKTFTSMLIMLLAERQLLRLDDTVGKFLPDYKHGRVTIAQLLSHQSGIPNYLSNGLYFHEIYQRPFPTKELVNQFCSDSLEFEPGTKFDYSNSGFIVLAAIIEEVTQLPMAEALSTYIFQPLGMTNSFAGDSGNGKNTVTGYLNGQPEQPYPIQNVVGAGGISTTAEDLLKWSRAMDDGSLVAKEKFEELITPRAAYEDWDGQYGYGWIIDQFQFSNSRKHRIIYHPGTDNGFYSMFLKQPDEGITIILLNNTSDFPRFEISDLILNQLDR